MCYAIPARLVKIEKNIGIVDYFGEKRRVLIDCFPVKVGDYVYAQGGIIINKVSEKEAKEILDAFKEVFFKLKDIDKKLSEINAETSSERLLDILERVNRNKVLEKEDLLFLLNLKDKKDLELLYKTANNIRQRTHKNASCVHGIVEFSNFCKNNCLYCGIKRERNIKRYRLDIEDIIRIVEYSVLKLNFKAIVLQSGEDLFYDEEKLIYLVSKLKEFNILIILSIGEREKDLYKKLYSKGARGVLLRFETSNKEIFKKLKPDTTLEKRLDLIRYLKELGYILATGFLVGFLDEKDEDIINNILLSKDLNPDMYSFGPFIPEDITQKVKLIDKEIILKITSIIRLLDKDSNILVTSASQRLSKGLDRELLLAGANSMMINLTPKEYRDLYCIYDRDFSNLSIEENIKNTIELLYSLGRSPTDLGLTNRRFGGEI